MCAIGPAAAQSFTDWGWPQPYEKISDKSIAWLKQKGWWPLAFGWQGPFSGQNTTNVVMDKAGLLEKRGLETKFQVFAAGPDVNEAVASARIQVGNGGNFPFTSLLDRGVPVRAIAVVAPNLKHSTVVPLDSPVKKLADFKDSNPPATIGIVTGSSAEFYFTQAAEVVEHASERATPDAEGHRRRRSVGTHRHDHRGRPQGRQGGRHRLPVQFL